MKIFMLALILFAIGPSCKVGAYSFNSCHHGVSDFKCVNYLRNYDGDTITFDIPKIHPLFGRKMSIRLQGVDTAEIRTKDVCEKIAAHEAKAFVEEKLSKAKTIHLLDVSKGKYFRLVADVIFDGVSLSKVLLNRKLAIPYDGGTKPVVDWCRLSL